MQGTRGQQIGEYAVLIGIVATAFISTQMYVGRRVAGRLVTASQDMLGTVAPIPDPGASNESTTTSRVRERGGPGAVPTVFGPATGIHTQTDSTTTGSSSAGFLLAEAYGPYLGEIVEVKDPTYLQIVARLAAERFGDEEFDLEDLDSEEGTGVVTALLKGKWSGRQERVRFRVLSLGEDEKGDLIASLDTNTEGALDGQVDTYAKGIQKTLGDRASAIDAIMQTYAAAQAYLDWLSQYEEDPEEEDITERLQSLNISQKNRTTLRDGKRSAERITRVIQRSSGDEDAPLGKNELRNALWDLSSEELDELSGSVTGKSTGVGEALTLAVDIEELSGEHSKTDQLAWWDASKGKSIVNEIIRENGFQVEGQSYPPGDSQFYNDQFEALLHDGVSIMRFVKFVEQDEEAIVAALMEGGDQETMSEKEISEAAKKFADNLRHSHPDLRDYEIRDRTNTYTDMLRLANGQNQEPMSESDARKTARTLAGLLTDSEARVILAHLEQANDRSVEGINKSQPYPDDSFVVGPDAPSEQLARDTVRGLNAATTLLEPALDELYGLGERAQEEEGPQRPTFAQLRLWGSYDAASEHPVGAQGEGQLVDAGARGITDRLPEWREDAQGAKDELMWILAEPTDPGALLSSWGAGSSGWGSARPDVAREAARDGVEGIAQLPTPEVSTLTDDGIRGSEAMAAHLHPDEFLGLSHFIYRRFNDGAVDPSEPPLFSPEGGLPAGGDRVTHAPPDPTGPVPYDPDPRTP